MLQLTARARAGTCKPLGFHQDRITAYTLSKATVPYGLFGRDGLSFRPAAVQVHKLLYR